MKLRFTIAASIGIVAVIAYANYLAMHCPECGGLTIRSRTTRTTLKAVCPKCGWKRTYGE